MPSRPRSQTKTKASNKLLWVLWKPVRYRGRCHKMSNKRLNRRPLHSSHLLANTRPPNFSPPAIQSQHMMQSPQQLFMPPNQIAFSAPPQPHQFLHSGAATVAYGTDDPRSVVYPSGSASVGGMPQAHHPQVIVIRDS